MLLETTAFWGGEQHAQSEKAKSALFYAWGNETSLPSFIHITVCEDKGPLHS